MQEKLFIISKDEMLYRLQKIRQDAHLSALKLSQKLGKHDDYINRLESQKKLPPLDIIFKILEICNVSFPKFFYYNIDEFNDDITLVRLIRKVPKDKRKLIFLLFKEFGEDNIEDYDEQCQFIREISSQIKRL